MVAKTCLQRFVLTVVVLVGACDRSESDPSAVAPATAAGAAAAEPTVADIRPAALFKHPGGYYTAEVPLSWGMIEDPKAGPFGGMRLSQSPDLMVSYVSVPAGAQPDFEAQMASFFPGESPVGELVTEDVPYPSAHRRFTGKTGEQPWGWWIRMFIQDGVFVTATVSDAQARFDATSGPYLEVLKTIKVPPVPEEPDDVLPTEHTESDIERILSSTPGRFWGQAIDDDGKINPVPPQTTETQLIEGDEALAIIQEGVDVGLAQWCNMPWKPYYFANQDARRAAKWPDRKVAYAGTLFGISQGRIQGRVKAEVGDCTRGHRKLVEARLAERPVSGR